MVNQLHLDQPTARPAPLLTLAVGHEEICSSLSDIFTRYHCQAKAVPDPMLRHASDMTVFSRDPQVELLDGTTLIPYALTARFLRQRFFAILPQHLRHVQKHAEATGYGRGISREMVGERTRVIVPEEIVKRAKSSIEGGNCFLFKTASGVSKAIIGKTSLYLTLLGLEEQTVFLCERVQELANEKWGISDPEEEFLLMARNLNRCIERIYNHDIHLEELKHAIHKGGLSSNPDHPLCVRLIETQDRLRQHWGGTTTYRARLSDPLSEEERSLHKVEAIALQAKMIIVRRVIAEDLQIKQENITWLDQNDFHIDMELTVAPSGSMIYLNDPLYVLNALNSMLKKGCSSRFYKTLYAFKKNAQQSLGRSLQTALSIFQALEAHGYRVRSLPGIFSGEQVDGPNFMNGLFIPCMGGHLFVTNGSSCENLQRIFKKQMELFAPSLQVCFLGSGEKTMEEWITHLHGGIHCLTRTLQNRSDDDLLTEEKE